jgi:hypothetical protein
VSISLDHSKAKEILFEHAANARLGKMSEISNEWLKRVQQLGDLCPHGRSATVIAALGTAILAKATDINVDVYSLLDRGESASSYSARSLADNVWARHRAELDIDLGANGTNPLNNTPFIGKTRIDDISGVRNRKGWAFFIECMEELRKIGSEADCKEALKGFIVARSRSLVAPLDVHPEFGDQLTQGELIDILESFVSANSEGGRRAQATAAAMLDSAFGDMYVLVGVINDPDRRTPLDVSVKYYEVGHSTTVSVDRNLSGYHSSLLATSNGLSNTFHTAFEIKDKPIQEYHVRSSIEKTVKDHAVRNLVFVAVGEDQATDVFDEVIQWAAKRGVKVSVFCNWINLYMACKCFAPIDGAIFEGKVFRRLIARCQELGVARGEIEQVVKRASREIKE